MLKILKLTKVQKTQHLIYDVYRFHAFENSDSKMGFQFLVPIGMKPHQIVKDLLELTALKKFMLFDLHEVNGMQQIKSIREVPDALKTESNEQKR